MACRLIRLPLLQGRNEGGVKGPQFPGRRIVAGGRGMPKSPNNVTSTFLHTIHLLPKDLRFEYRGAKLAYCPERNHVTPLALVEPAIVR